MTLSLRSYQEQALEAEARHRAEHLDETRLAIVMATGLGKTIVMAERAKRFMIDELRATRLGGERELQPQGRVLILVHTDELAQQAEAKVRLVVQGDGTEITVGVVKADRDETDADIIIGSIQTLLNPERRQRITDVGLVIVDECELYAAPQWSDVLRHFGCLPDCTHPHPETSLDSLGGHCLDCMDTGFTHAPIPLLGFTATLERSDGLGLGHIWQNVVFSRDISWGVRHGYLVQPIGHRLEIDPTNLNSPRSDLDGPFSPNVEKLDQQLIEAMAPEKIVEKWMELAGNYCHECREAMDALPAGTSAVPSYCPNAECGVNAGSRPTIAFMPLVRSAMALRDAFIAQGVLAAVVWGDMPGDLRKQTLKAYDSGEIEVLVNAMVLTRGFDAPKTSCVIIGRPTKSRNLGIQMAGRGLRPVPGIPVEEQDCILIYVQDATTDLFTHADLSDRPVDRRAEGALTVMEDAYDLGKELDEANRQKLWTGRVDAREFDPLVQRSSKVWRHTEHGTPFLPISTDGEYVFIVGTSVFVRERDPASPTDRMWTHRLHKDLPDLELAMTIAEDEAQERGGDLGRLLADKNRAWRKDVPSTDMQMLAERLGLKAELDKIMFSKAAGKAGKVSDLISKVQATRALEPMVKRIKEMTS